MIYAVYVYHMNTYVHCIYKRYIYIYIFLYIYICVYIYIYTINLFIHIYIYMIPSPAHETHSPTPNGLDPPGIPLYLVFSWYSVPLGISTHAMHIQKLNSLPAPCSYTYIFIFIYNPLYTLDKQSCYILCLYTTYILSTCYIFTSYALSTKKLHTI